MERIVSIHAVCTASIRSVTDSMELACLVVQKEKTVIEVCVYHFYIFITVLCIWAFVLLASSMHKTLKTYISDAETPPNDKTTDVPGPTWWIIAFALSFVINIIFITHTMIRLIKQW